MVSEKDSSLLIISFHSDRLIRRQFPRIFDSQIGELAQTVLRSEAYVLNCNKLLGPAGVKDCLVRVTVNIDIDIGTIGIADLARGRIPMIFGICPSFDDRFL